MGADSLYVGHYANCFLINGLTKGDWAEALMFAIATAVGLTPEMLPMIVTTNLVKGSREMAKEGTIMKMSMPFKILAGWMYFVRIKQVP